MATSLASSRFRGEGAASAGDAVSATAVTAAASGRIGDLGTPGQYQPAVRRYVITMDRKYGWKPKRLNVQ
jgi:hypothetical protein